MSDTLTPPDGLWGLDGFSAGLDSGPLLIQDAGDNRLIRQGGAMRTDASGLLLAEARDIFFAIVTAAMHKETQDIDGNRAQGFTPEGCGLHPLIGTGRDAMFGHRAVVLLHRLGTLVHAARWCAAEILTERVAGFNRRLSQSVRTRARLAFKMCGRFRQVAERPQFINRRIAH